MKPNPTTSHFLDASFDDASENDPRARTQFVTEYGVTGRKLAGGFDTIAALIQADAVERKGFRWAPDANVAIRNEASCVWDAMQKAYTLDYEPQCLLLAPVYKELEEWLNEPHRKHDLAKEINRCLKAENGFLRFFTGASIPERLKNLSDHYLDLLCFRRKLAIPYDGKTIDGHDASDKSFVMSKITEKHGQRGKMFARSGRDDFEKTGLININDEAIVVLAFIYGMLTREHVCLITTDQHMLDIFYKFQWFIDTQYRTWLAAQMIAKGEYGDPQTSNSKELEPFFEGECEIYRKRSFTFDEVLKFRDNYYSFEVMHVQADNTINWIRFKWEPGVEEMLQSKSVDGRNSTIFDTRNVHIATSPIPGFGEYIVVGNDKSIVPTGRENALPISQLEIQHAIHSRETFSTSVNPMGNFRSD